MPGQFDATAADRIPADGAPVLALPGRLRGIIAGRGTSLAVYAWSQVVLLLWWAGQYPGLVNYDSTTYITHVTLGPWVADHSVLYDWLVLLSIDINRNVWVLTLLQTVAWSATLAYFVRSMQLFGVRGRWAAVPAVILPCLPPFGGFASMVQKDSAFALVALLLAGSLLRVLVVWQIPQRRRWFRNRALQVGEPSSRHPAIPWRLLVAVLLEYVGLVLFRGDGFIMVAFITVVVMIAMRGLRALLLGAALLAVGAMFFASEVVYPAAHIQPAESSLSYGSFYADISVIYRKTPKSFTAADKRLLAEVGPLKQWRRGGNCYDADDLPRHGFRKKVADQKRKELARLWFRVLDRHPYLMVKSRLCRSAIAWNPLPPPPSRAVTKLLPAQVPANFFGRVDLLPADVADNLHPDPLIGGLGDTAHALRADLTDDFWLVAIWRGATWCYLAYLAVIVAAWRGRNWRILAAAAVPLGNQLMVLTDNPAQLYRYMAAALITGVLLTPLVTLPRRSIPDPAAREPAPEPDPSSEQAVVDETAAGAAAPAAAQ